MGYCLDHIFSLKMTLFQVLIIKMSKFHLTKKKKRKAMTHQVLILAISKRKQRPAQDGAT